MVSNSSFLRELLLTGYRVPESRLRVLPPGVNLRRFEGTSEPRRLDEVLYVGWLSRAKGVFELVVAISRLRECQSRGLISEADHTRIQAALVARLPPS